MHQPPLGPNVNEIETSERNAARRAQAIRRVLERQGPPGQERERKLEILGHAVLILLRDYGVVPGWVDEFRAEVIEDRL